MGHCVILHFVLSNGEGKESQWVRHRDLRDKEELNTAEAIGKISGYLIYKWYLLTLAVSE